VAKRPLLIGLTGSIGMGKTATAGMFARLGLPVYDADATVHALYAPGGAAVAPIAQRFPQAIHRDGVDRGTLSAMVLSDAKALADLEAIVHPLAAKAQKAFIDRTTAGGAALAVLDIPLLFETQGDQRLDAVVVVSAPAEIQRQRAMARPGMTCQKLESILARQMPDAEKRRKADFVVDTGQGLDHAEAQVRKIVEVLHQRVQRSV